MSRIITVLVAASFVFACGKVDDKVRDQAKIEQDLENQDYDAKVAASEAELSRKHRFYQGVVGTYEGTYISPTGNVFSARIIVAPTVRPYVGHNKRRLEEVTNDLLKLGFNISVSIGFEGTKTLACNFLGVPADLTTGEVEAFSECAVMLNIFPTYNLVGGDDLIKIGAHGKQTAEGLLEGKIERTKYMSVFVRSNINDSKYWMALKKF